MWRASPGCVVGEGKGKRVWGVMEREGEWLTDGWQVRGAKNARQVYGSGWRPELRELRAWTRKQGE